MTPCYAKLRRPLHREDAIDGSRWIAPTDADRAKRARWSHLMPGIDESLVFHPLRIAVLTVSDTRTADTDRSGPLLAERLTLAGHQLAGTTIVPDEVAAIRAQVRAWVDDEEIDLILSTGGTGFAPRDVTPEAVKPLIRREMDGFAVVFHQASLGTVGVSTLQSRAFAGQIDDTFIFCLPGSAGACRDAWDLVLAAELDSRYRPCSLAGLIPRLRHLCA
jgi:molybdenum cofactor biosynthesis protein B